MVKKKIKLKPEVRLYLIIVLVVLLILFFFIPKNYTKKYKKNDYQIVETYNKKTKRYSLNISKDDKVYEYNFTSKYLGKKLIKNIETKENDNTTCIVNNLKNKENKVLCIKDGNNIDYRLVTDIELDEYKNSREVKYNKIDGISTFDLLDKNYLIWNYNSFKYIENNNSGEIKLFNSDYYNISLATLINDYLVIPNYDAGYNYKELILINLKTKTKESWKLNYDVSFESYVLGTYKDSIYLVDKKNKVEYELNIKKRTMDVIGNENREGKILVNNKFEKITMLKLINNIMSFTYDDDQEYILEGTKLILKTNNTKVLLSNLAVNKIVYKTNNYVYYLVRDTLYYYDQNVGEVKVMSNFEWNFNSDNVIYIY